MVSWETPPASIHPLADFGPVREIKLAPGVRPLEIFDKKANRHPERTSAPVKKKSSYQRRR